MSILAPQPGAKACYVRSYDAAHLRAHPKQRISAMKFLLGVKAYDPKTADKTGPDDLYYYTFSMSVARRGDKRLLTTAGDCQGGESISCVVDCDGGSVALDKMPPVDSLIVRLNDHGIQMFHDCDGGPVVWVKAGVDDKVFRLNKAAVDACKALDESEEQRAQKSGRIEWTSSLAAHGRQRRWERRASSERSGRTRSFRRRNRQCCARPGCAAPDHGMEHIAMQEAKAGERVVWLEPVTDAQYDAKLGG